MRTFPHAESSFNDNSAAPPTDPTEVSETWLAAVHHAAHAVLALLLHVEYGDVALLPANDHHNNGSVDQLLFEGDRSEVRRAAVVRLAGDAAEYVVDGRSQLGAALMAAEIGEWTHGIYPPTVDRDKAYMGVSKAFGREFVDVMFGLVGDAFSLVFANWSTLVRVAVELINFGFVTADRLREMIGNAAVVPDDVIVNGGAYVD